MDTLDDLDAVIRALATVGVTMADGDPGIWRALAEGLAQARDAVLAMHQAGVNRVGVLATLMAAHHALPVQDPRRHGWLLRAVMVRLEADDLPRGPELRAKVGRLTDELARKAARGGEP